MDWNFGQLMDAVDQFDQSTNTTTGLIMSSDHGDFGGDYHLVEKWYVCIFYMYVHIDLFIIIYIF